jgi:hypothetical protein
VPLPVTVDVDDGTAAAVASHAYALSQQTHVEYAAGHATHAHSTLCAMGGAAAVRCAASIAAQRARHFLIFNSNSPTHRCHLALWRCLPLAPLYATAAVPYLAECGAAAPDQA